MKEITTYTLQLGEGDEMISQAQSELTSTVKMQSKISKAKAFVMKQFKSAFKQKKGT